MSSSEKTRPHWSFWLLGVLFLLWNLMGAMSFVMQMNPEVVATFPEADQAMINGRPMWVTVGFALSVFGGALGCVLLLLKRAVALYVFLISLVGTLLAVGYSATLDLGYNAVVFVLTLVLPLAISIFLIWYTKFAQGKHWL